MACQFNLETMSELELAFLKRPMDPWKDKIIDHYWLRKHIPLSDTSTVYDQSGRDQESLGDLRCLSNEVILNILSSIPVQDLMQLFKTSRSFAECISRWSEFNVARNLGGDLMRALLSTRAMLPWTIPQLVEKIFTTNCELCDDHAEILYLPKLMRCCLRCLSTDRRLLAVRPIKEVCRRLPAVEAANIAHFETIPQDHFFGHRLPRMLLLDYTAALEAESRLHVQLFSRATLNPVDVIKSTEILADVYFYDYWRQTRPPKVKKSVQTRRHASNQVPLLQMPQGILTPPENSYYQNACSIYLPAIDRIPDKSIQLSRLGYSKISVRTASYCAGCAFYWNYHSPLPYQYHRAYLNSKSNQLDSPLWKHISTCIYAQMHWNKLYPNEEPLNRKRAWRILDGYSQGRRPFFHRFGGMASESISRFESLPYMGFFMIEKRSNQSHMFQQPYDWPTGRRNEDGTPEVVTTTGSQEVKDHYADLLLSQETASQASWACATPYDYRHLFHGPFNMMRAYEDREKTLVAKHKKEGKIYLPYRLPWCFDRFAA